MVNLAKDWLWSYHRKVIGLRPRLLVDELPIELPKDLDKYLEGPIAEKDIDRLRQSVNHQSPYGNEL